MNRQLSSVARAVAVVALLLVVAGAGGCRTMKAARGPSLDWLRGQPVLVVAEAESAPTAEAREAALTRSLSTVPVRAWPSEAEAALGSALADPSRGETRLERAREAAEQRRIPWLVVTTDEALRVEDARGGAVRWESDTRPGQPSAVGAAALRGAVGTKPRPDGEPEWSPAEIRLAPMERLVALRALAVSGDWEAHTGEMQQAREQWPADPAMLVHGALSELLEEEPTVEAEASLRRATQVNPDGESELLALALLAENEGRLAFALRARELLVRLHPRRIDYRPELADLQGRLDRADDAVGVLRGGMAMVPAEELDRAPTGTAPHEEPLALPYADLRFSLGWYLAALGDAEGALLSYERALEVYEAMGRPREQSDAVNNAGVVLVEAGRPAVAVPLFRKARRLRREQGRDGKAANSMHNLARALADSRRVAEAIETYEEAARDYAGMGDELSAIESLYETMEHHAAVGDVDALERRADGLLGRLAALDEGAADARKAILLGSIWFARAQGRMKLRNPEGALEAYTVALDVYRRQGRRLDEAQTLYSMAVPNMALFRLEDAYTNLMDALELAVELGDSSSIVDIRGQLAEVAGLLRASGRTPPEPPASVVPFLE